MSILDFFKRKGIDKKKYELVVSSDRPYETGTTDDDGVTCIKTFTPPLEMKTEKKYRLPLKVCFDKRNLYSLEVYLPDATTAEMLKALPQHTAIIITLWLFLDDGSFFIMFPDEVNPRFDEAGDITAYHLPLLKAGFHSERKNLKNSLSPEEICDFTREQLVTRNIVEIQPRILGTTDDGIDCRSVEISSPTAEYIAKSIEVIRNHNL